MASAGTQPKTWSSFGPRPTWSEISLCNAKSDEREEVAVATPRPANALLNQALLKDDSTLASARLRAPRCDPEYQRHSSPNIAGAVLPNPWESS
jgi:hypothetical protein